MPTYVVLFRGINVGGSNLLPMKDLSAALGKLGYSNIRTYIQSGNVVLEGNDPSPDDIADIVAENHGFRPAVLVLDKAGFLASVQQNPFDPDDGKSVHFYYCAAKPVLNRERLDRYLGATEEVRLIDRVFYLYAPDGIGRSRLAANVEPCLGVPATGRNLNTIRKLAEMVKGV